MAIPEIVQKILPQVDDSQLDSDSLFDVESGVLDIAARWNGLGLALRISQARLTTIKATPGSTPESCLKSTLTEFLKKNYDTEKYGEPSWRLIVAAVASKVGGANVELALKIAQNHSTTSAILESVQKTLPQVDDSKLDSESLFDIESEVIDVAARWEHFGSALRIKPATLSTIKATPGSTPESCLKSTLSEFLKKNYDSEKYGEPSWRLIVAAVASKAGGANVELALKIAQNHSMHSALVVL